MMSAVIKLGAQIQITQSHMPSISDTIRYSTATAGTLNFKQTGTNYNWNYSSLGITGQGLYKYEAVTSTPYSILLLSKLPFGAIGYKVADSIGAGQFAFKNLYNFFEKKTNVWRAVGTGFTLSALPVPTGGIYSDFDEIFTLPLNYNDSDFTTFQVTTPLGNQLITLGSYKQKGTRSNKVEGWGTITTPYGSNIACLKIKSTVTEIDSIKLSTPAVNLGFPADRVEYKWLSTTEKIPVLEVVGTEIAVFLRRIKFVTAIVLEVPAHRHSVPALNLMQTNTLAKQAKTLFISSTSRAPTLATPINGALYLTKVFVM